MRHHVAPVTGGVADAEENRFVITLRLLERLAAPWKPVDRIVGVLEQVRTGFLGESIGHELVVR